MTLGDVCLKAVIEHFKELWTTPALCPASASVCGSLGRIDIVCATPCSWFCATRGHHNGSFGPNLLFLDLRTTSVVANVLCCPNIFWVDVGSVCVCDNRVDDDAAVHYRRACTFKLLLQFFFLLLTGLLRRGSRCVHSVVIVWRTSQTTCIRIPSCGSYMYLFALQDSCDTPCSEDMTLS